MFLIIFFAFQLNFVFFFIFVYLPQGVHFVDVELFPPSILNEISECTWFSLESFFLHTL